MSVYHYLVSIELCFSMNLLLLLRASPLSNALLSSIIALRVMNFGAAAMTIYDDCCKLKISPLNIGFEGSRVPTSVWTAIGEVWWWVKSFSRCITEENMHTTNRKWAMFTIISSSMVTDLSALDHPSPPSILLQINNCLIMGGKCDYNTRRRSTIDDDNSRSLSRAPAIKPIKLIALGAYDSCCLELAVTLPQPAQHQHWHNCWLSRYFQLSRYVAISVAIDHVKLPPNPTILTQFCMLQIDCSIL